MRPSRLILLSSRITLWRLLTALLFFTLSFLLPQLTTGCTSAPEDHQENRSDVYRYTSPSQGGTGKIYMGREIARPLHHSAASWLDRPQRETEEAPDLLVKNMNLKATDVVADIGAGTGYFSFRMATVVTEGRVLAVDIQPEMLRRIEARSKDQGIDNVVPILGSPDNPRLPRDSVDKVLMVDAYHEFSHPREMMIAVVQALRDEGEVFLVEYRGEETDLSIKPLHRMTEEQARLEFEAVGLRWVVTWDFLPHQHVMVFRKR